MEGIAPDPAAAHSAEDEPDLRGIIPRSVEEIFNCAYTYIQPSGASLSLLKQTFVCAHHLISILCCCACSLIHQTSKTPRTQTCASSCERRTCRFTVSFRHRSIARCVALADRCRCSLTPPLCISALSLSLCSLSLFHSPLCPLSLSRRGDFRFIEAGAYEFVHS